jgi:hypothetical protein
MRHRTSHTTRPGSKHADPSGAEPSQSNASNDGTRGSRRRNRRARLWQAGVLAAAAAGITVLAAACGGSTPTTAAHQRAYQNELAYAQCMRGHGDPGFPDPQGNGFFSESPANRGAFSGPRARSANKACAHLEGPRMFNPVQFRQHVDQALKFVACMRAHGIVNYPEPKINWGRHAGAVGFTPASGIDPNSPQFKSAQKACPLPLPRLGDGGS